MSHVHGAKTVASQMKTVADAGTAKMMDASMGKMGNMMEGASQMMVDGMGSMLKMGGEVAQAAKHSKAPGIAAGVATGAVTTGLGKTAVSKFVRHPLVLFSLGFAVGYYVCKYRKSIISASGEAQQHE
ncbi:hypothetical protein [Methylobacter sp.]|uniref:hypothetical protein n=1 Tax=Methylobacter sp. TaxID=2051955 RepID=UPI002FDD4A0E